MASVQVRRNRIKPTVNIQKKNNVKVDKSNDIVDRTCENTDSVKSFSSDNVAINVKNAHSSSCSVDVTACETPAASSAAISLPAAGDTTEFVTAALAANPASVANPDSIANIDSATNPASTCTVSRRCKFKPSVNVGKISSGIVTRQDSVMSDTDIIRLGAVESNTESMEEQKGSNLAEVMEDLLKDSPTVNHASADVAISQSSTAPHAVAAATSLVAGSAPHAVEANTFTHPAACASDASSSSYTAASVVTIPALVNPVPSTTASCTVSRRSKFKPSVNVKKVVSTGASDCVKSSNSGVVSSSGNGISQSSNSCIVRSSHSDIIKSRDDCSVKFSSSDIARSNDSANTKSHVNHVALNTDIHSLGRRKVKFSSVMESVVDCGASLEDRENEMDEDLDIVPQIKIGPDGFFIINEDCTEEESVQDEIPFLQLYNSTVFDNIVSSSLVSSSIGEATAVTSDSIVNLASSKTISSICTSPSKKSGNVNVAHNQDMESSCCKVPPITCAKSTGINGTTSMTPKNDEKSTSSDTIIQTTIVASACDTNSKPITVNYPGNGTGLPVTTIRSSDPGADLQAAAVKLAESRIKQQPVVQQLKSSSDLVSRLIQSKIQESKLKRAPQSDKSEDSETSNMNHAIITKPLNDSRKSEKVKKSDENLNDKSEMKEDEDYVPQLMIGPDGNIILDEQSVVIEKKEIKTESSEIVDETNKRIKRDHTKRSKRWNEKDTNKFYTILGMVGTDFDLMTRMFKDRDRTELKKKFKREEKADMGRIETTLQGRRNLDVGLLAEFSSDEEEVKGGEKEKRKSFAENVEKIGKRKSDLISDVEGEGGEGEDGAVGGGKENLPAKIARYPRRKSRRYQKKFSM